MHKIALVENKGLRVDISAPSKDIPSMSMALERYIKKMNKK
jgi:uroporphyrinogen-III synthase